MMTSSKTKIKYNSTPVLKQFILYLLTSMLFACTGERPDNLGLVMEKLTPCPATANCVSSGSTDNRHKIAPLQATISTIKLVLLNMDNVKIVEDNADYILAEFTTTLGFVDDMEFYAPKHEQLTQVRSASRLGKNDLGANREHIEDIRQSLNQ